MVSGSEMAAIVVTRQSRRNTISTAIASSDAEQDRVAHARHRVVHELGQVVDDLQPDARRQRRPVVVQRAQHAVGDVEDVAAQLPRDAEERRRRGRCR